MQEIKTLVTDAIKLSGGTHAKLGEFLGVSRQAVWRWSTGALEPEAGQVWKMMCLCYQCKMHVIAKKFDEYIRYRDEADEFK